MYSKLTEKPTAEIIELLNEVRELNNNDLVGIFVECKSCGLENSITIEEVFYNNFCSDCHSKFTYENDYDKIIPTIELRYALWFRLVDRWKKHNSPNKEEEYVLSAESFGDTMDSNINIMRIAIDNVKIYMKFFADQTRIEYLYQEMYDTLYLSNEIELFEKIKIIIGDAWDIVVQKIRSRY